MQFVSCCDEQLRGLVFRYSHNNILGGDLEGQYHPYPTPGFPSRERSHWVDVKVISTFVLIGPRGTCKSSKNLKDVFQGKGF